MNAMRVRRQLGRLGLTQINYVSPVRVDAADGLVGQVYRQTEDDFGVLAPPVSLHSSAPTVLAACWLMLRETMVADGLVARTVKEAVATTVSLGNTCPFCVSVHGRTLGALNPTVTVLMLANDRQYEIADPEVRAAVEWARACATADGAAGYEPVCPAARAPELVGTVVLLHYLNRMVNVFLGEVPLPPHVPRMALGTVMRVLGRTFRAASRLPHPPGRALDLLPSAPVPDDLAWAAAGPVVADAFARAGAAVADAGARSVPSAVRDLVTAELAGWRGERRGPSRAWATAAVSALPADQRPAGLLALLTAFASDQVDRTVVDDFRAHWPDDARLIDLTSWAALAAARRVAGWIPVSAAQPSTTSIDGTA